MIARPPRTVGTALLVLALVFAGLTATNADDWPQWRGPTRDGVWRETGLRETLPAGRIDLRWRAPIGSGYSSPTVANGRVYVTDRVIDPAEIERVHCFNATTGAVVWTHAYDCMYDGVSYDAGPRCAVLVDDGRAYSLGAMGHLFCFDAATGKILFEHDLNAEYAIDMPIWGIAASPLIEGDLLIVPVSGADAWVVAFDAKTGVERWRALSDRGNYAAPIVVDQAGRRVLVGWTGDRIVGLDPGTGRLVWEYPFVPKRIPLGIATPIEDDGKLFFTAFYDGCVLLQLDPNELRVQELWRRGGPNEIRTDGLQSIISTPFMRDGFIYGVDSYGQLRCLDMSDGSRVWEDLTAVPKARWATIHMVQNGDRTWMLNERGELLLGALTPAGFTELGRTKLLDPTREQLNERGGVCWSHPAYANRHVFARNDEELVCADLSAPRSPARSSGAAPVTAPAVAPAGKPYAGLTSIASPRPRAATAVNSDWPGFLGPHRDGHSPETNLARTPPRLLWTMARGQGYACPAVADGRLVYTHREGGEVHIDCLDAETGLRFWRVSQPCDFRGRYIQDNGPRSTPVIDGDRVYVHGIAGALTCFDLASGNVVWQRELSKEYGIGDQFFGVVASPIVFGDLLIQNVGAPGGPSVAAFDKHTGELVWGAGEEWGPSCASPVITDVRGRPKLFVMTGGDSRPPTGGLMVLDPATGAIDFTYPFRSRTYESVNGASPVVANDRVFLTASYNVGTAALALDADGGFEELWKTRRIGLQFSNPLHVDGHLYAIDGRSDRVGELVCLDPDTGAELSRTDLSWEEELYYQGRDTTVPQSVGEGSLLYVDGQALCLGDNGHLLWLDLDPAGVTVTARTSLFRANESWSPPVLSRGLLYVCQNKRERFRREPAPPRLLCFDLRADGTPPATSRGATSRPATSRPAAAGNPPAPGFRADESDPRAIEIADAVMTRLGGRDAWDATAILRWTFFGARSHVWDRRTGRIRIEGTRRADDLPYVVLMDLDDGRGRVWIDGNEVVDEAERDQMLQSGMSAWINDAYWLVMPYKLKDSGVRLRSLGVRPMLDEREADVLELTFRNVGDTPGNKYDVYVARDTGLVEQWDFYRDAADETAAFQIPWHAWKRHGRILLSGDRGRRQLTDIAVYASLPETVFGDPGPVDWSGFAAVGGE